MGRWPLPAWFGVAAFTVLTAASIAGREPETSDVAMAVLLLGSARERALYLVRRRSLGSRRALGGEVPASAVGAVGLVVAFTM